jgi:hypothetical protein
MNLVATPAEKLVALETIATPDVQLPNFGIPTITRPAMNRLRIAPISVTNLGRLQPGQEIASAPLQLSLRTRLL